MMMLLIVFALSVFICFITAWCCDMRIHHLIDEAFEKRCANCEFKKSKTTWDI